METESQSQPRESAASSRLVPGFCFVIFLLFGLPLLNPAAEFYRWDTWIYQWPLLMELKAQWMAGQVPFWISSVCGGTPLLANIAAAALYPLRLIHYLLPLPYAHNVFVFTHWALSFLFTFLWLRRGLNASSRGALLGAMVYAFSGYARGMWDNYNFMAMPWIPLWLLALSLAGQTGRFRMCSLLAALAWLMMILGGDTQQLVLSGLAGGIYCLFLPALRRRIPVLVAGVALGTLLGAPQWLPTYYAAKESYRSDGLEYSEAVERSFHPLRAIEFAVPYLYGTHETWHAPGLFGKGATRVTPWSASHHVGLIPWVLAGILLCRRKRREAWWALALLTVAGLLSLGRFLPGYTLWHSLPILGGFRYPEKFLFWLPVAFALFSGLGHDAFVTLRKPGLDAPKKLYIMIGLLGALILFATWFALKIGIPGEAIRFPVIMAGVYGLMLLIPFRSAHPSTALLAVLLIQLLVPWYQENPLSSRLNLDEPPPLAAIILQSDDPQGRVYTDPFVPVVPLPSYWNGLTRESEQEYVSYASALRFNSCRLWGLRSPEGFSPLEQTYTRDFRIQSGRPVDGKGPDSATFVSFIQTTGIRWLLTTPARWEDFQKLRLSGAVIRRWEHAGDASILVHIDNVYESGPTPARMVRPAPGRIEIDITDDLVFPLRIAESASAGWASPNPGTALEFAPQGQLQLNAAETGTTVELKYRAPGWSMGLLLHFLGWAMAAGLCVFPRTGKTSAYSG